ncbi:hypothetical protein NPIL_402361 [Nephila pilipes]|uniref:Uncharacterized protein n=1 Tax=Nephila pilipes TaxID=299642 RepID=A0A8X6R7L1_NEPPI|nr:hypothetical protein NPIL_402361 [Nephila pilipes]
MAERTSPDPSGKRSPIQTTHHGILTRIVDAFPDNRNWTITRERTCRTAPDQPSPEWDLRTGVRRKLILSIDENGT